MRLGTSSCSIDDGSGSGGNLSTSKCGAKTKTAANNCVVQANGLGVYRDPTQAAGSPAAFRAFGGIGKYGGRLANHGGTMISSDGLAWSDPVIYDWPDPPQRYDTSNNIFFDPALKRYVATTRRHPTTEPTP